jgi:glutamate dehydrogenase
MMWFMRHVDFSVGLAALVERFRVDGDAGPAPAHSVWLARGAPPALAARMHRLEISASAPDAILVAERAEVKPSEAMDTLAALGQTLDAPRLRRAIGSVAAMDSYDRQALAGITESIDGVLRELAADVLTTSGAGDAGVAIWAQERATHLARSRKTVTEMLAGQPTLAKVSVAAAALAELGQA